MATRGNLLRAILRRLLLLLRAHAEQRDNVAERRVLEQVHAERDLGEALRAFEQGQVREAVLAVLAALQNALALSLALRTIESSG